MLRFKTQAHSSKENENAVFECPKRGVLELSCDQIESIAQVSSWPWTGSAQGAVQFTQARSPICELGLGSTCLVKVKKGKSRYPGDPVVLDSHI